MKNEARRHHYISEFYLNGFAKSEKKHKKITTINCDNKNYFITSAKNLANVRDFNRINIPGMKPDAVEQSLSDFETKAAEAIREVHATKKFDDENRLIILELMAMFTSRNPSRRENTTNLISGIIKTSSGVLLDHDPEFRKINEELAKELGVEDSSKMSDGELNRFTHEKIKLTLSTEYFIHTETIFLESIFNALANRKWTLVQASEQTGPIITSDNPVILCWNDPEAVPGFVRHSPGHGMKNTTVYFSLSQHLALIGTFDDDAISPQNENLVAVNNTMNIIHANNQIYSPNFDFHLITESEGVQDGHWFKKQFNLTKK